MSNPRGYKFRIDPSVPPLKQDTNYLNNLTSTDSLLHVTATKYYFCSGLSGGKRPRGNGSLGKAKVKPWEQQISTFSSTPQAAAVRDTKLTGESELIGLTSFLRSCAEYAFSKPGTVMECGRRGRRCDIIREAGETFNIPSTNRNGASRPLLCATEPLDYLPLTSTGYFDDLAAAAVLLDLGRPLISTYTCRPSVDTGTRRRVSVSDNFTSPSSPSPICVPSTSCCF